MNIRDKLSDFVWGLPGLVVLIAALIFINALVQSIPSSFTIKSSSFSILPITLTAYSPSKAQTQGNPFETASGQIVSTVDLEKQLYAAASRDLLLKFTQGAPLDFGSKVYLEITIIDTMHERWTNRIDLFVRNQQIARYIGNQPNRNIIILKE